MSKNPIRFSPLALTTQYLQKNGVQVQPPQKVRIKKHPGKNRGCNNLINERIASLNEQRRECSHEN